MSKEWCPRIEAYGFIFNCKEKFDSARECYEFIESDQTLIIINYLLRRLDYQMDNLKGILKLNELNFIKPYNFVQKRYSDGFDY